jgi:hypothetical protein
MTASKPTGGAVVGEERTIWRGRSTLRVDPSRQRNAAGTGGRSG